METGTIVELTDRNSGYIRIRGKRERLFFHADGLEKLTFSELKKGDRVTFAVVESLKGPYAVQVSRY